MPSGEGTLEARRRSKLKKFRSFLRYCFLLVVSVIAVIIIPGIYIANILRKPQSVNSRDDYTDSIHQIIKKDLPWYIKGGVKLPKATVGERAMTIWPEEDNSDRIIHQLMYLPSFHENKVIRVMMLTELPMFAAEGRQDIFSSCPVKSCSLSRKAEDSDIADAILLSDEQLLTPYSVARRSPEQVWVLFLTKPPYNTKDLGRFSRLINWTASYRSDSEIVVPYTQQLANGKWVYYNESSAKELAKAPRNFAAGKTKKVLWFINDLRVDRNRRVEFARELNKYIHVDVFGQFNNNCPCKNSAEDCLDLLRQYKFYLAFEPFNCKDYVSGKFFVALQQDVLPVVMGAAPEDYEKVAPPSSFIHVQKFSSPKKLAEYLVQLDRDDDLYNDYFRWKDTGEMIDTRPACRLCAMLHGEQHNKIYPDVNLWWRQKACTDEAEGWKTSATVSLFHNKSVGFNIVS